MTIVRVANLLICLLASAGLVAQTAPPQSGATTPTFRSETTVVLVPTVVTDRAGKPVFGLTRSDFAVLEDDRQMPISFFEEVRTTRDLARRAGAESGMLTNEVEAQTSHRLTLIVLDTLNTRFTDQVRARRQLLDFVSNHLQEGEPVALMLIGQSGLRVVTDFTTDPKLLVAALQKVRAGRSTIERVEQETATLRDLQEHARRLNTMRFLGPRSDSEITFELEAFQSGAFDHLAQRQYGLGVRNTLTALRQIAESFAGLPGRKSLIWVSGGIPFFVDDSSPFRSPDSLALYESTWRALSNAQVSVYPMDVRGLVNPAYVGPQFARFGWGSFGSFARESAVNMENFARMTGGRFCAAKYEIEDCFRMAAADSEHYYLLGFYMGRHTKPGWRRLNVQLRRPGLQARSRSRYYAAPSAIDPKSTWETDLRMGLLSPLEFTALPLRVRWTGREPLTGKTRLDFRFHLPPGAATIDENASNRLSLEFAALVKKQNGDLETLFSKEVTGDLRPEGLEAVRKAGIDFDGQLEVPEGQYVVRFLVRDNVSGRMGSVSEPLRLP